MNSLNDLLKSIAKYRNIVLAGDINIDISNNCEDSRTIEYLTMTAYHGMLPAHTIPTRYNRSCLDYLLLKTIRHAFCYVAHTSVTDHDTVLLFLDMSNNNIYTDNKNNKKIIMKI